MEYAAKIEYVSQIAKYFGLYFRKSQIMTKKDRLEALIAHYSDGKPTRFAKHIGVAPSTISTWLARDSFDYDLLFAKCEMISPEWLLTGKGDMLKAAKTAGDLTADGHSSVPVAPDNTLEAIRIPHSSSREEEIKALRLLGLDIKDIDLIPFVSTQVAAGFGSADFAITPKDIRDYYVIPKWRRQHVDFIIEVTGDSMLPKYYPGQVIGCSILHESRFIQWNKPHVIATREQGLLVKRLMPSSKENCLTAVSDNKDYPPFDIPQEEITGIAIVVGYVGLE